MPFVMLDFKVDVDRIRDSLELFLFLIFGVSFLQNIRHFRLSRPYF